MTSGTVCYTQSSTCALLAQVMTPVTSSNCPVGSNVTWYGQFGSVSGCNSNLPIMLNSNAANPYPQLGTPVISVCASQNCNLPPGMSSSNNASSSSSATCPSAGSSSSISCYGGATFSGTLPSGGLCTCKCGASASVADYDYSGGSGSSNSDSTQFLAASTAACSNTLCTTKFPNGCAASAYVNASYATAAQAMAAAAPKSGAVGTGAICVTFTQTCTVATPCRSYLTTGTLVMYAAMSGGNGMTAPAQCGVNLAALTSASGYTWNTICTTNNSTRRAPRVPLPAR